MTTVREALGAAIESLTNHVATPTPEAEILMGHVLGCERHELFLRRDALTADESAQFVALVERRKSLEPLQYITGHQNFRGREIAVGPGVLVPRPETEVVVEKALERIARLPSPVVVDVGTGSGAIAVTIASERSDARVWATEISEEALSWAQKNLGHLGAAGVEILLGDLLEPLPMQLRGRIDVIVSNPPYLSEAEIEELPRDVRDFEPRIATVSGRTGLEIPSRVVEESYEWLSPGGWLVIETSPLGSQRLEALMRARYHEVTLSEDLTGAIRVAEGRKP